MRNNIGFPNRNSNMEGVDTAFNTWDLNITPAASDFVSVTDTGFMGPRQADGSLPNLDFMQLGPSSRMIDQGTDVGLPFNGAAPDLGAYEAGGSAGGAPSTGGTASIGGALSTTGGSAVGGSLVGGSATSGAAGAGGSGQGTETCNCRIPSRKSGRRILDLVALLAFVGLLRRRGTGRR